MYKFNLEIELLSPALASSGVGFGAAIDTDIVFDELGLPFIPVKRIKGCLRDSAREIEDMFSLAGITKTAIDIDRTFGSPGRKESASVYFSNLTIEEYEQNKNWLHYFVNSDDYSPFITPERILGAFTEIFHQTKIDEDGVAFEHSLRTIRVLQKGLIFFGRVYSENDDKKILNTLMLACLNFRLFGTKRNRGFGEIHCMMRDENGHLLKPDKMLEDLCTI